MVLAPEDILKLLAAIIAGGLIGLEREYRDKAAGFRTIIFICFGAALFTIFSIRLAGDGDPTRIAANIVTGVGFLGAGAILRDNGRIMGLTTAATIWLAAALGIGFGAGYFLLTGSAALLVLLMLWLFPTLERRVDNLRETRTYEIVCAAEEQTMQAVESLLADSGLRVLSYKRQKRDDQVILTWHVIGSAAAHERLSKNLYAHPDVRECTM